MNERLMLKTRIEALRANLGKLQKFLEEVPDRKRGLEELLYALSEATKKPLSNAYKELYAVVSGMEVDNAPEEALIPLRLALNELKQAQTLNKEAVAKVREMQKHCFRIEKSGVSWLLGNNLQRRTQPCLDALAAADAALEKERPNAKLWRKYREEASAPGQAIFAEYVDFLGGLALRDAGFDTGISQVADELVSTYKPNRQLVPLHALPTRQQTVAKTLAQVIRVGFPEWTIWALPFTAHEFWHVTAQKDLEENLRAEIAKLGRPDLIEPRFQSCLADAFATYTMGPAYAYSAFLLLLDPVQAFATRGPESSVDSARVRAMLALLERSGVLRLDPTQTSDATVTEPDLRGDEVRFRPILTMLEKNGLFVPDAVQSSVARGVEPLGAPGDDTRASAILTMLKQMDSKSDEAGRPAYEQVRNDLREMWDAAVSEVGGKITEQTAADNEAMKVTVEALWKVLERNDCAPFLISSWGTIQGWQQKFLANDVASIELSAPVELRQVLNAIWCARIDPTRTLGISQIAELGWTLAKRTQSSAAAAGGSRGRPTLVPTVATIVGDRREVS
jgi:hypothetical protein